MGGGDPAHKDHTKQARNIMKKHIEVAAAIVAWEGKVLCMRRGRGGSPSTEMKWEFPGGKVEPGETPQETIVRELLEEMDYAVEPVRRVERASHEYPDFSITLEAWLCRAATPLFSMKEHTAFRWMPPREAGKLDFAAADRDILSALAAMAPTIESGEALTPDAKGSGHDNGEESQETVSAQD